MGSYSASTNVSSTANSNAPIAQENVSNPINLSNTTGFRLNSNDVKNDIRGSTLNTLDGGAIGQAFGFGSEAIKLLADATKENNRQIQQANAAALGLVGTNNAYLDKYANKEANSDWLQNKTLLYVIGAVAIFWAFKK
jgi:hypothetical protein